MINELSRLAKSIENANIQTEKWHPRYKIIPKITADAPCVRILLKDGRVSRLCRVGSETHKFIRKYGDNQGSFPAMNLTSLFRITDENIAKIISAWIKANGVGTNFEEVKSWCTESNWSEKTANKYRISVIKRVSELKEKTDGVFKTDDGIEPLNVLINDLKPLQDPAELHRQLHVVALDMIEKGVDVQLALQTLFYHPKKKGDEKNLSVIFDSVELGDRGFSTIERAFSMGLNSALLSENSDSEDGQGDNKVDAFGLPYSDVKDSMPKMVLPIGEVSLRTMFHEQLCQYRYGKIENGSYPLSSKKIQEIKDSFEWLALESNKNKTWVLTGKGEVFFAYPSKIPVSKDSLNTVQFFAGIPEDSTSDTEGIGTDFLAIAENFLEFVSKTKKYDPDNVPDHIQLFALNKYDRARSRIAYSRCVTPDVVIERSKEWRAAADNLPPLWRLNQPKTLFPLSIAPVMNRIWKRDGTPISDKYRHTGRYCGIDLFFGVSRSELSGYLSELTHNSESMAIYASNALRSKNRGVASFLKRLKETLSLMGMYLYWMGIRKDDYMNEFPYLFGQLLKISDAVHELYCEEVRKDVPTQFVGSSMYSVASEMPLQTFNLLIQRVQPYLAWCRTNRKKHKTANYYLYQYTIIADKMKNIFPMPTHFSDAEKAQFFIGYLASFENRTNNDKNEDEMKGENDNV